MATHDERIENLLADALAVHDERGADGLAAFLHDHAADRTALERGLARCRQLGLLGEPNAPPRDFPERLGEFRLVRRLGSGGMGVVYEAEQESLGRRVALKVVRPELLYFEGARERFRREIEAVARLSHPAVVPVLASGEQDGVPWYAMELLSGRTVHEVCAGLAGRDPATLAGDDLRAAIGASGSATDPLQGAWWQVCSRVVHAVALGVRHAHLRGIVHRDIKPSNVMLTADGRTVLLDFGVALLGGGPQFTRTGGTPGSPAFMSPEQLRGDAVDERTDVYSLGATLWQLLALVPPFRGEADLQKIRDGQVPAVTQHNREVPRELVIVLHKAMDRDRERRYPDIEQFAQDLVAVMQRRPIRARRLDWTLRGWRWCQRHRVLTTALTSMGIVALVLPAAFAWRERGTNRELAAAAAAARQSAAAAAASEAMARESLGTTLDAIYSLLVRLGDEKFRYVPAAAKVAEESLAAAVAMYDTLLPKHEDHVRLHVDAGKAVSRFAEFLGRRGAYDEAIKRTLEGLAHLRGDSLEVAPEWLETRSVLGITLASLFEQSGDPGSSHLALDAVERDLQALAGKAPFARHCQRAKVQLLVQRAGLHDPVLEPEAFLPPARQAVELARELHRQSPEDAFDARRLVERLDTLATGLCKQKHYDEASALLDEALTVARSIRSTAPFWPPQPLLVANVLETQGNLFVERRDARAATALKECLRLREQACSDFPLDLSFRCELAAALHNLAVMNWKQGQDDLSLQRIDRALALQRSVLASTPQSNRARDYLRNHLSHRGALLVQLERPGELHEVVVELAAMDGDVRAQRAAARLWCRLHTLVDDTTPGLPSPAQCADRALAALQRAEALGWGVGNALKEPIYDPLRDRPEFGELQARIEQRLATPRNGSGAGSSPSGKPSEGR